MNNNKPKPELPMDVAEHFCPNPNCAMLGQKGQGNLRVHSKAHSKAEGRLRCSHAQKVCGRLTGRLVAGGLSLVR